MTYESQIDSQQLELKLPLWAVTDNDSLRERGLPGALRSFVDELRGPFLDLFTREEVAAEYLRKGSFSNWQPVELSDFAQVRSAVLASQQRGCVYVGLDCTGSRNQTGRFFTIREFLPLVGAESRE
jgi:hypothetical protein